MSTVQLLGAKIYTTKMAMISATTTDNVSLALEFQKCLCNAARKYGVIDQSE